jgi:hypothetical protein
VQRGAPLVLIGELDGIVEMLLKREKKEQNCGADQLAGNSHSASRHLPQGRVRPSPAALEAIMEELR